MIQYTQGKSLTEAMLAYKLLEGLDNYYPEFGHWYTNKVMPGLLVGSDKLILASDKHQIIGVGLGKRNHHETKLRCIRVAPDYQKRGVGIHLVDKMLRALDDSHPHCTVAQELIHDYSRAFVNFFDFDLTKVTKDEYRKGGFLEYHFN